MSIIQYSEAQRRGRNPYGSDISDSLSEQIEDHHAQIQRELREENQNIKMLRTPMQKLQSVPLNRIDQGIMDSISYQFRGACLKFSYVLLPRQDDKAYRLRNWDLWGPFLICLIYLFFVNNSTQFFILFFGCFLGASVISFNVRVLGGEISYFQALSILGYCMFPIFLGMFILKVLLLFTINNFLINLFINIGTIIWAIIGTHLLMRASKTFIGLNVASNKKLVAMYPLILFYIFIGLLLIF